MLCDVMLLFMLTNFYTDKRVTVTCLLTCSPVKRRIPPCFWAQDRNKMVCSYIPCLLLMTSYCGFYVLLMYEHDLNVGHNQPYGLTRIEFSASVNWSRRVDWYNSTLLTYKSICCIAQPQELFYFVRSVRRKCNWETCTIVSQADVKAT